MLLPYDYEYTVAQTEETTLTDSVSLPIDCYLGCSLTAQCHHRYDPPRKYLAVVPLYCSSFNEPFSCIQPTLGVLPPQVLVRVLGLV